MKPHQPADPQDLRASFRRAEGEASADRFGRQNPQTWGIAADIGQLATSQRMTLRVARDGSRRKVIEARRADVFELMKGSLAADENEAKRRYDAAQRYITDWNIRSGVRLGDSWQVTPGAGGSGEGAPGQSVSQAMIDAGGRIERVHARIGLMDARVLVALVKPTMAGHAPPPWRVTVAFVAGESDRHGQGAVIRQICANLVLAYAEIDREDAERWAMRNTANDNLPMVAANDVG